MSLKPQRNVWDRFFNRRNPSGTLLSSLVYYPHFHRYYSLLKRSQWWTSEQLQDYQNEKLRTLVMHAYAHVPYYRRSFDEAGLRPSDIGSIDDLHVLPLLTKEQVRANIDQSESTELSVLSVRVDGNGR